MVKHQALDDSPFGLGALWVANVTLLSIPRAIGELVKGHITP